MSASSSLMNLGSSISNVSFGLPSHYTQHTSDNEGFSSGNVVSENNIRILSTLVPDEIIYFDKNSNVKQKTHTGVLFFADVSGFTDLCEKFTKQGKSGASRITKVLNEYIGVMVQEIMSHNGDILNFSGDAFLALWKIKDYASSMSDVVHAAIDCALGIQKSHGQYKTEIGIILKVKIALAAGQIIVLVIGDSNFMVLGNAMFDVKDVGNICNAGDIIISPTVKVFIEPNQYQMESIPGIPFIKILGIDFEWSPSTLSHSYDIFDKFEDKNESDGVGSDTSLEPAKSFDTLGAGFYVLRPSINYAVAQNMEQFLRKFVITPVIRAIDMGEQLENLTEMRQVVIVFINIVTRVYNMKQLEVLLEDTYTTICEKVNETGGCMNKVSMFDKDLMFLVIYGLRGFKHILQAQQALYCARRIRDELSQINQIASASVGVAMGVTYCGVVGHPMRKEYTVIGRTVNKAARLMIAYPDMVTCDRQTFLESQLQSRYFTLQPARHLKGFSNVGPIYKFDDDCSEEYIIEREWLQTNTYPILDRPRELELFFGILNYKIPEHSTIHLLYRHLSMHADIRKTYSLLQLTQYNMMIINGAGRRGKTRILNEIGYYIRSEIPHYKCTLDKNSRKYKVLRCVLCEGCKISNIKDLPTRTKYVWRTLTPFKVPEFLCALNDMLYVNFDPTEEYERLTEEQKLFVKRKMVKYLSRKIFKTMSLITIDNMENVAGESWILYREIIDCGKTFTCATISTNANLPPESKHITKAPDTLTVNLTPIHEWYHSALICQFLNVRGISLELEKYVQEHSYGNPGWIESFLTTLRHSTILKKLDMEKAHAFKQGYVLPDLNLLKRQDTKKLSNTKLVQLNVIKSLTTKSNVFAQDDFMEGWDIYQQTLPHITEEYDSSELITVCTLAREVGLHEIDTEDYVDIRMLSTYDSLNVQEQHVLKCSAILGEQFTRSVLEYVMQSNFATPIAKAIQRLFEMKVFGCLRASYNNGDITVRHYLTDPLSDNEVKCECEGFPEELFFLNMPKYASCAYICFRKPAFRQMCMNLLTETQANIYHLRAIWYLENQTRRCYSCGRGYFARIFGQYNDDGMQKYSIEVLAPGKRSSARKTREKSHKQRVPTFLYNDYDIRDEIAQLKNYRQALRARTFDDNNLVDCRCVSILSNMYSEIIEHNQEIGRYEPLLNSILEYTELCIRCNNDSVAFTLIARATDLLENKLKYLYAEPTWQVPLTKGRISTLLGRLHINRQDPVQAERCLLESLASYNLSFPKTKLAVMAAIKYHKYKQKICFIYYPNRYIGSDDDDVRVLAEQTADTLCALQFLYIVSQQYDKAYLACLWGLTEALRSNCNFYLNCMSFRNVIRMEILYPRPSHIITRIENMALSMCYRKHSRLEPHEFEAVIKMYAAIFLRIGLMENILTALRLGGTIMTINSPKYGGYYSWRVNSFFIRFMTFTYNIKQLVKITQELLAHASVPSFKGIVPAPIRTYVLAMQFMVVTTYSIIPLEVCKTCFSIKIEPTSSKILSHVEMNYYIMMWLWHVRKKEWQASVNIYNQISDTNNWPAMNDPNVVFCIADLVEGLLLLFVQKISYNDTERIPPLQKFLKYAMDLLQKASKKIHIVRSRYYLLKAYHYMILGETDKAEKLLDKGETAAIAFCNFFETDWIKYTRNAWINWPDSGRNDRWVRSATVEKIISNWDDFDRKKLPMFTLRLPTWTRVPREMEEDTRSVYVL